MPESDLRQLAPIKLGNVIHALAGERSAAQSIINQSMTKLRNDRKQLFSQTLLYSQKIEFRLNRLRHSKCRCVNDSASED